MGSPRYPQNTMQCLSGNPSIAQLATTSELSAVQFISLQFKKKRKNTHSAESQPVLSRSYRHGDAIAELALP